MYRMKEEDAVKILSNINNLGMALYVDYELIAACKTAIRALKHTIPAKITHEATLYKCPTCPSCKNVVGHMTDLFGKKMLAHVPYCEFCGQHLDWSDENTAENTANKKPKIGHWYDVGSLSCRCSNCGCKSPQEYKYCPHCGAYMEETSNA